MLHRFVSRCACAPGGGGHAFMLVSQAQGRTGHPPVTLPRREPVRKRTKVMIVGASALGAGGASYAVATGEDNSRSISGPALDRASAAALTHTGGGMVTGT